ncbi:cytochrome c oxidase subunit II [Pseudofrankia sp. BMG5.36]|uniref:aa3-type cytochrome oxidase subunit II n=1 Tax=Pseudofrankia sp. BMG5.36 TaxID=1834512 RepID=UPI000A8426BE|nr:cytochrome c oxidase subunit II [Pseudofrankia sp. BMG5.36]
MRSSFGRIRPARADAGEAGAARPPARLGAEAESYDDGMASSGVGGGGWQTSQIGVADPAGTPGAAPMLREAADGAGESALEGGGRDAGIARSSHRRGRVGRVTRLGAGLAVLALTATACGVPNFGFPDGVTNQTPRILNLWKGSAIAALAVGVLVWGLIFYAIIAFRKRSDVLPRQVRYNLPVEVLYTIVPLVVVAGLFYYTARDETKIDKVSANPDVTVNVVGFRWNWQFRYTDTGQNGGNVVEVTGQPGQPAVLVLPEGRSVKFVLTSPDVIHSFWVPEFLFKRDVVPGRINTFEVTPTETGTFIGRCAELCGADHDKMNFYVNVVPADQYDKFIAEQEAASATAVGAPALTTAGSGTTSGSGQ